MKLVSLLLTGSTGKISLAVGGKVVLGLKTIGNRPALVVLKVQDSKNLVKVLSSQKIAAKKPFTSKPITFAKAGSYKLLLYVGTTKKIVTVTVTVTR